jgi:hypothetical protein
MGRTGSQERTIKGTHFEYDSRTRTMLVSRFPFPGDTITRVLVATRFDLTPEDFDAQVKKILGRFVLAKVMVRARAA